MSRGHGFKFAASNQPAHGVSPPADSSARLQPSPKEDVQGANARLLTYNVHSGVGLDGKYDLQRIGRVVGTRALTKAHAKDTKLHEHTV